MVTFNEADVCQALIQTEGNSTWAAARFAAPRTDLNQFIDAAPSLQAVIRDLQEDVDDEAESGLRDAVCAAKQFGVDLPNSRCNKTSADQTTNRQHSAQNATKARYGTLSLPPPPPEQKPGRHHPENGQDGATQQVVPMR